MHCIVPNIADVVQAATLAEQYKDFGALVRICEETDNKVSVGSWRRGGGVVVVIGSYENEILIWTLTRGVVRVHYLHLSHYPFIEVYWSYVLVNSFKMRCHLYDRSLVSYVSRCLLM